MADARWYSYQFTFRHGAWLLGWWEERAPRSLLWSHRFMVLGGIAGSILATTLFC